MNTNPNAKRILCYSDSLTYGRNAVGHTRHNATSRWTGVLQNLLGNDYEIIEEGLGGRTTDMEDPFKPGRDGISYFYSCISSHFPFDTILILLGTNDLKDKFSKSPEQIANSLLKYDKLITDLATSENYTKPKVILLSPPHIQDKYVPKDWGLTKEGESKQLASYYSKVAIKIGAYFMDTSQWVTTCTTDGVHLDAEANKVLGQKIYEYLIKI